MLTSLSGHHHLVLHFFTAWSCQDGGHSLLWSPLGSIAPQTTRVFGRGGWKRTQISISCSCCKEFNTH